jgi:hypothetical protein
MPIRGFENIKRHGGIKIDVVTCYFDIADKWYAVLFSAKRM